MADARMRIGIIGLGAIGKVHGESYAALADRAEIASVCDLIEDRVTALADKHGARGRFTDYHDLLASDVEAVSVCVPNSVHKEIALAAAKNLGGEAVYWLADEDHDRLEVASTVVRSSCQAAPS